MSRMNLNYTWNHVHYAVMALGRGRDDIRKRLRNAYADGLSYLKPDDFPQGLVDSFREIDRALTREKPQGDQDRVWATTMHMSEDEASRLAEKIVNLYDTLAREYTEMDFVRGNLEQ